jgi:hypothetical protein
VLILGAEDYSGRSPNTAPGPGPKYLDYYKNALADAGIGYDVYDVDALGRTAPSYLGVLSHYKAVVWYTGDDFIVRGPNQVRPGGPATGGPPAPRSSSTTRSSRRGDFMNEGGKLLVTGKNALEGSWEQFLYNRLGRHRPSRSAHRTRPVGQGALANDPPGQNFNCVAASNDFQQYWLGAYLPISIDPALAAAGDPGPR